MYTSGVWMVKAGHEDEFVRTWQMSADQVSLAFPEITFRLLRDMSEPRRFVSVGGPWRNPEQVEAARSLPSFQEAMAATEKLVESGAISTYSVVAEVS